jgi:hypothetical protein
MAADVLSRNSKKSSFGDGSTSDPRLHRRALMVSHEISRASRIALFRQPYMNGLTANDDKASHVITTSANGGIMTGLCTTAIILIMQYGAQCTQKPMSTNNTVRTAFQCDVCPIDTLGDAPLHIDDWNAVPWT